MVRRLLLLTVLVYSASAYAGRYNAVLDIGDPMPAFAGLPAAAGGTLSSADLDADVVVLVSLANHCPWVRGMDADLVALAAAFRGSSVRVVGFAVNHRDEDRLPAMKVHAESAGYDFSYVYDDSQALGRALGATHTPEYFVFDKSRRLVYTGALYDSPAKIASDGKPHHMNGPSRQLYVHDAVVAALAGKAPPVTETGAIGCSVEYER
jgi:Redoxin